MRGLEIMIAGWVKSWSGQPAEGAALMERGMRLDPFHYPWMQNNLATAYIMLGKYDLAKPLLRKSLQSGQVGPHAGRWPLVGLIAIAEFEGDDKAVERYKERLLDTEPNFHLGLGKPLLAMYKDQDFATRFHDALVAAGLPEQSPGERLKKPSIAVLPFSNLSHDKEQDYFADGITEDITTDLSKVPGLHVAARAATLRFRNGDTEPQAVAKALGVAHILSGSVRRAGDTLRITAKLIDGGNGRQLWAERFDRPLDDIFAIQDEIAGEVVAQLSVALKQSNLSRVGRTYTPNIEAYDAYIQGRAKRIPPTPANLDAALKLFEKAIELDPGFAGGYAGASFAHVLLSSDSTDRAASPANHLQIAIQLARRAVELDPTFGPGWGSLAEVFLRQRKYEEALQAITTAMETAPSDSLMRLRYARILSYAGRFRKAIRQAKHAMRMSPDSVPMYYVLGANYRAAGQFEDAVKALREHRSRLNNRVLPAPTLQLIASLWQAGDAQAARKETQALLQVAPHFTVGLAMSIHAYKDPDAISAFSGALRQAGLPDEPGARKARPASR